MSLAEVCYGRRGILAVGVQEGQLGAVVISVLFGHRYTAMRWALLRNARNASGRGRWGAVGSSEEQWVILSWIYCHSLDPDAEC